MSRPEAVLNYQLKDYQLTSAYFFPKRLPKKD